MNSPNQNSRTILVVDANKDDLFYTCMLLHRFGYTIYTAFTDEKAIEFMTAVQPSAVIVDVAPAAAPLLPSLTQDPRFFDIPLILLSWWPYAELNERTRQATYAAFLRKPLDVIVFYQTVQAAIEKSPRRNIRIVSHLRVRFLDSAEGTEGYATVLSEYGMFFRTFKPRSQHSVIPLTIEIHGRLIRAEAIVLYAVPFEEGLFKEPGMGMKFTNINREDRKVIASFILEELGNAATRPEGPAHAPS